MRAEASTRCTDCRRHRQSGLYSAVLCIVRSRCIGEGGGGSKKMGLIKSCPQGCHADGLACLEERQREQWRRAECGSGRQSVRNAQGCYCIPLPHSEKMCAPWRITDI